MPASKHEYKKRGETRCRSPLSRRAAAATARCGPVHCRAAGPSADLAGALLPRPSRAVLQRCSRQPRRLLRSAHSGCRSNRAILSGSALMRP